MLYRLAATKNFIQTDEMARHGILMAAFGLMAGFFDYLYQLSMSIMLTPDQYGTVFTFISIFMIVSIGSQAVQTSIAKYTSKLNAENNPARLNYLWASSLKRTIFIGSVICVSLCLFSPLISSFLNIDNNWYSIILFSCFILIFALPVNWGVLQGMQRFVPLGYTRAMWSLLKLGLGVLLVSLGFSIYGALLPLLVSTVLLFLLTFFILRPMARTGYEKVATSGLSSYTGLALIGVFCFAILVNLDVIMAKHYLSADDAGAYSAVSVLGRVAYYAPWGIAIAMFPKVSSISDRISEHRYLLRKAFLLTMLISGGIVLVYGLLSSFLVSVLLRDEYSFISIYLFKYGLAMFFFALSFLLMNYLLAINQTKAVYGLVLTVLVNIGLIVAFHSSIVQIVNVMLITGVISTTIMLLFFLNVRTNK